MDKNFDTILGTIAAIAVLCLVFFSIRSFSSTKEKKKGPYEKWTDGGGKL